MWLCWVGKLEVPLDHFGSWLRSADCERGPVDQSWLPVPYVASELSMEWCLTGTKLDIGQFGGQILICAGWYEKLVSHLWNCHKNFKKCTEAWLECQNVDKLQGGWGTKFNGIGDGVNYWDW